MAAGGEAYDDMFVLRTNADPDFGRGHARTISVDGFPG
jgi:hypothetical protein